MAPRAKLFVGRIDWRSYWTFPIKTRLIACVPLFSLIHPRIDFPTGLLVSQPMAIPVFNWKITNPNCGFPIAPGLISWFDIYIYVYIHTQISYITWCRSICHFNWLSKFVFCFLLLMTNYIYMGVYWNGGYISMVEFGMIWGTPSA
jgi:hypothetical protein